jgi:D-3-phosphoglycerate dehydrogenase / 2-oxoglutarate reductase
MKVLLLEKIHSIARDLFEAAGHRVMEIPRALTPEQLADIDADVIGIRSQTRISQEVFRKPRLVVAAYCIGVNQIDLAACDLHGCAVFHDRYNNARSVAELCMTGIGVLLRQLLEKNRETHSGVWNKSASGSQEIRGKRLGVVGYGNVGQQVGALAEAMGMRVGYYDLDERPAHGNARKYVTLQALLGDSDVVSLHVDGRGQNRNIFGPVEVAAMKTGAVFLNLSRGFVVVEEALADALRSGRLAGAAIDVHQSEPNGSEPFASPLRGLPNVLLTPHIGGSTEEAQQAIGDNTTRRVLDYLIRGTLQLSPSFLGRSYTDVMIPETRRIIYIHTNTPGQISKASELLASRGINIVGQHLLTNERIGYASFDVELSAPDGVVDALEKIPGAIRARIL